MFTREKSSTYKNHHQQSPQSLNELYFTNNETNGSQKSKRSISLKVPASTGDYTIEQNDLRRRTSASINTLNTDVVSIVAISQSLQNGDQPKQVVETNQEDNDQDEKTNDLKY